MVVFLFSSLLEVILFLIVTCIVSVYFQKSTMGSIWGVPYPKSANGTLLQRLCYPIVTNGKSDCVCADDNTTPGLEEPGDTDDVNHESSDEDKLSLTEDKLESTVKTVTKTEQFNFDDTTGEEFSFNEVDSKSTTSDDKYMSCNDHSLKCVSTVNEELSYEVNAKSATDKAIFDESDDNFTSPYGEPSSPNTSDKVIFDKAKSIVSAEGTNKDSNTTQLCIENIDENDFDKSEVKNKNASDESYFHNSEYKKYIISVPKHTNLSENDADSPIKIVDMSNKMSSVYEVNGASFVEDNRLSCHDNDELKAYELYQTDKMAEDDDEDMTTTLDMHIQTLPQGVIINSNVFLWDGHWHTMALVDGNLYRCAVCQVYCDRLTCEDHVETIAHLRNMDRFKPLKRFDLSIVRKINVDLHCGVCNDIFDIIDYKTHENSKTHEENLLTAINKVSDLMYDSNIHVGAKERNFHRNNTIASSYDRITSRSDRNTSSYDRITSSSDRNTSSYDRITSSDRNLSTPEQMFRNNGEYHFDANAINNNINVYEDSEEEEEEEAENVEEASEEYSYENEEYNTPYEGISYASMASKPTIQLPKFLKIDLGSKDVRVKFESWHMIVNIASNQYYCMVCNKKDHIRFKSQHCIACEHIEKLAKCTVVRAFEDYLIRKVDDKLYHCGHCNNLQYQNQMEDHIESSHPKINRNFIETSNRQKTKTIDKSTVKTVIEPKKTESDKSAVINKNLEELEPLQPIDPGFDIFGDIPLMPFGCALRIPALNFNFILKKDGGYFCALCDRACADVKVHVDEMDHVELMTLTPFIKPFQNHLTRAVLGMLHCSLCNKLFSVSEVKHHNIDTSHITALAAAMGMKKTQKPEKTKRVTILNLDTDKNGKNLATLPPLHMLPFNLPSAPTVCNIQQNRNENVKAVSPNLMTEGSAQKINIKPEMSSNAELPNSGQNGGAQNVFDTASVIVRAKQALTQTKQDRQNIAKNSPLHIGQNAGQNLPQSGQNQQQHGQNRQCQSTTGQNMPTSKQNSPIPGQSSGQIFPFPHNLTTQAIKSTPPMFNSLYPILPPVNTQILQNQFMGPPLVYNNAPRPSVSPFSNRSPNNSPNLLSPNIPVNKAQNNQEIQNKAIIITDRNDSVSGIVNSRPGSDNSKPGIDNKRYGSDNYRRDSVNSKCSSDNSKPGIDNKRYGSDNYRKNSVNSKCSSDNNRRGSENRRDSDNSRCGSDNSKSVNDNILLSDNIETDSQSEDDELEFDEEEMVFLKLKTTYFKITNMSYNTLVFLDNGIRYCFVCSSFVATSQQQKHVGSRKHLDCLTDNKFLDKYGVQLFRQMYLMYHCAICNELMTRKEIKLHLDWPVHVENYNIARLIPNKKNRKELKSGLKEYVVETQKEAIYHNVNEPNYHIRAAYQIVPTLDVQKDALESKPAKGSKSTAMKKNKMVIQNSVVMKIPFDHWHGITIAKNFTKCVVCQMEITQDEVWEHVESEYHAVALGKPFEKTYYPALVRKINECSVNCMTCNLELPNNEYMIHEHVNGRKHNKNQENIVNETSNSDYYSDCYEEYLNI